MAEPRLIILGVQLESEAYPNVLHRVRALESSPDFRVEKIHQVAWREQTQSRSGRARLLRNFWRMLYAHLAVLALYLRAPPADCVYIPYPASLLLWLMSFFPGKSRGSRLVADAFISLYDTVVLDRQLLAPGGLPAKFLYRLERRAFQFAQAVIVDTPQSAEHLAELFRLPSSLFVPIALATDENRFVPSDYHAGGDSCRVLFIGTLIPLHGLPTIVAAAETLKQRQDIRIKIIGDGQENAELQRYVSAPGSNIEWLREWQDSARIAQEIAAADICLGIFGGTGKTTRVLPFKLYAYTRIGRCVITSETECTRAATAGLDYQPWYAVPVADAGALASAILDLADDASRRTELAGNAARFYEERLSNSVAAERVTETLRPR